MIKGEEMTKGKDKNSLFESLLFTDNTFGSLPELSGQGHKSSQQEWGYEADNLLLGDNDYEYLPIMNHDLPHLSPSRPTLPLEIIKKTSQSLHQPPTPSFQSGALPTSRWRLFEIPSDPLWSTQAAGYGYLRPPWNLNPSRYVSRFPLQGGQGLAEIDIDGESAGGASTATGQLLLPDCESGYAKLMQSDTPLQFLREVIILSLSYPNLTQYPILTYHYPLPYSYLTHYSSILI